jgi:hypothetical protein
MKEVVLFLVVFVAIVFVGAKKVLASSDRKTIGISNVMLDPPSGAIMKAHDPIYVDFDYSYFSPNEKLYVWAKILDETYDSTYQGSVDTMSPGKGKIRRFVFLTQPGKVSAIDIVVKDQKFNEIFHKQIKVDYTFVNNQALEKLTDDGLGSTIKGVSFDKDQGSTLPPGTKVNVRIEYEINTVNGLDIWAIPDTDCNMTYQGTSGRQFGNGVITKYFIVSEPCQLTSLKLVMGNAANKTVYSKSMDVNFKFE